MRKNAECRQVEFARRKPASVAGVRTWIVSCEDLILSKRVWARDSASELQGRDVLSLLAGPVDRDHLRRWAARLGVSSELDKLLA